MKPTFYGVDLILYPRARRGREPHELGKVLEVGGLYAGAILHKVGDHDYYRRVVSDIRKSIGNKLFLLAEDPEWAFRKVESPEMKHARQEEHREEIARTKLFQEDLAGDPRHNFYSVHDFLVGKVDWEHAYGDQFMASMNTHYLQEAKKQGMNVDSFIKFDARGGVLKYIHKEIDPEFMKQFDLEHWDPDTPLAELPYGEIAPTSFEERYVPIEDVGLVWSLYLKDPERQIGRERLWNGYFVEGLVEDKALLYFYSRLLPSEKRNLDLYLPSSFLYGMGMHTQEAFREWLAGVKGDIIVKKPLAEHHGIGVEFLSRSEMARYDVSSFRDPSPGAVAEGYRKLVVDFVLKDVDLGQRTVIFQEFVESQKIEVHGREYPATARAIVMNGKFMGAFWRYNPKADETTSLTDRFRHNASSGAECWPVSAEDQKAIAALAEGFAHAFDETNRQVVDVLDRIEAPHLADVAGDPNLDLHGEKLNAIHYLGHAKEAARGHLSLGDSIRRWGRELGRGEDARCVKLADDIARFIDQIELGPSRRGPGGRR